MMIQFIQEYLNYLYPFLIPSNKIIKIFTTVKTEKKRRKQDIEIIFYRQLYLKIKRKEMITKK